MKRFLPRSLAKRWYILHLFSGVFSVAISLIFERFWSKAIASDPILDWRFWIVLGGFLVLFLTGASLLSGYWLKSLSRMPVQVRQPSPDQAYPPDSSVGERKPNPQALHVQPKQSNEEMMELRNFVANASHELRTPLTTLKLRVEALREGALEERELADKFLREMESEIDHLSQLVNDMLDLSRIEATRDEIPHSEVDLKRVIAEVCAAFHVRAEKSNIQIQIEAEEAVAPISGVEEQIRRLIYNLIDNAIKYTPNGGWVKVRLYQQPVSHHLILEVQDNGFGIPPYYLPHIFERFYRAEATRPRYGTTRGSGLGLAIVKAIVDAHGGQITVQSEVGKGTLFRIEFPP